MAIADFDPITAAAAAPQLKGGQGRRRGGLAVALVALRDCVEPDRRGSVCGGGGVDRVVGGKTNTVLAVMG